MGSIEIICGPMFSGKTEELLRRLNKAVIAGKIVKAFRPRKDKRYFTEKITSHNGASIEATEIEDLGEILLVAKETQAEVVGIDELQFLEGDPLIVLNKLADLHDIRVICSGLDQNYLGEPFGHIPRVMAIADKVIKLNAVCIECKEDNATKSFRKVNSKDEIVVGGLESYLAVCRKCFRRLMKRL